MDMQRRSIPFLVKSHDQTGEFSGYAAAFHNIDATGEILAQGAFRSCLKHFLQNGFIAGLNHDWNMPIGKPIEAEELAEGLFIRAKISDTVAGRDARTLLRDGVINRLSIGYRVVHQERLRRPDDVRSYWKYHGYRPTQTDLVRAQAGVKLLRQVELYEVSPVAVPANARAEVTSVKSENSDLGTWQRQCTLLFERYRSLCHVVG